MIFWNLKNTVSQAPYQVGEQWLTTELDQEGKLVEK